MIGGYIFSRVDEQLLERLQARLLSFSSIPAWQNGFLFHTPGQVSSCSSDEWIALSDDILARSDPGGEYVSASLDEEFMPDFVRSGIKALEGIESDFRMVVLSRLGQQILVHLVSNRAGSGRIYYHKLRDGIVFCSDLRFLLTVVPFEVSGLGIYAVIKYGAIPEPLTISSTVEAVPPAHVVRCEVGSGRISRHPFFRLEFPCDRAGLEPDVPLGPVRDLLQRSARFLRQFRPAMLLSGGIDSSLYGAYLSGAGGRRVQGFYCSFGDDDPEYPFARQIAERIDADLYIARMTGQDALRTLDDAVRLTDHPFSDFSSLPTTFVLRHVSEHDSGAKTVVECNGADDCFGFAGLMHEAKTLAKHRVPAAVKRAIARTLGGTSYWKWESSEGALARVASLADVHERTPLDYLLVLAPVEYLRLNVEDGWDERLHTVMEEVFSATAQNYASLSYMGKATVRQLLHINSRRWAAKALSVGESLGMRVVYPYIWRSVLIEQGKLPWSAKVRDNGVKWPLKKLLEEHMPASFIYRKKSGFVPPFVQWLTDPQFNGRVREVLLRRGGHVQQVVPARVLDELLSDALRGRRLRSPVLNFLWAALFTESWIQARKS